MRACVCACAVHTCIILALAVHAMSSEAQLSKECKLLKADYECWAQRRSSCCNSLALAAAFAFVSQRTVLLLLCRSEAQALGARPRSRDARQARDRAEREHSGGGARPLRVTEGM